MDEKTQSLVEAIYLSMQDEGAITETFGDIDTEAMASVFADYEANVGVVGEFCSYYAPILAMNGFSPKFVFKEIVAYMKEL